MPCFDAAVNWSEGISRQYIGDFWRRPQLSLSSSSFASNSTGLESLKVGYAYICTYHKSEELLKERTRGPWNAMSGTTHCPEIPSLTLLASCWVCLRLPAHQRSAASRYIGSIKLLSWCNNTSSSECLLRLEVHSTFNSITLTSHCFSGLHFCWSMWTGSLAFTHAPWMNVLFNALFLNIIMVFMSCRHDFPWQGSFKRWIAVEQPGVWVCAVQHIALSLLQNVCNQIWYTHSYSQQVVVTYVSPVEGFVTGIKIANWQKLSLIAWSFPSEGLDHLIYRDSKWNSKVSKICHRNKEPAVLKSTNALCFGARKNQKHYEWNVTPKMLKHHNQNMETLCWSTMLKTLYNTYVYRFRTLRCVVILWAHNNSWTTEISMSDHYSEVCNDIKSNLTWNFTVLA